MEPRHRLTQDQIDYFEAFGFLLLRGLFDDATMAPVIEAADALWREDFGGRPDPAATLHQDRFVERRPVLMRLIDDARLYDKLEQLLGERFIFCGSEGNHGVVGSPTAHHWHADRPGAAELGYLRIKVMLYLVPMTQDNGALRVIPGSHRAPFHQALLPFVRRHVERDPLFFGEHGANIPAHVIETSPGDAVLFSQTLYHCPIRGGWKPPPLGGAFRRLAVRCEPCGGTGVRPIRCSSCTTTSCSRRSTASRCFVGMWGSGCEN